MESLFDDRPRSDMTPRGATEGEWAFLDRTGRPWGDAVRDFWNRSLAAYGTKDARSRLVARLRDRDATETRSAAFELLVHTILDRLRYPVAVEAQPVGQAKRPDFRVRVGNLDVWVEATLANPSHIDVRRDRAVEELRARLDRLPIRDFWLSLHIDRVGDLGHGGAASIARNLTMWLRDRRELLHARILQSAPPKEREFAFDDNGWALNIRAEGTRPGAPASGGIVKVCSSAPRPVDHAARLRARVKEKAEKYRRIAGAHLIAVNSNFDGVDDSDVMDALFGDEETLMHVVEDRVQVAGYRRARKAAWRFQGEFCSRSVSAVAVFRNAGFTDFAGAVPTLVHHPAAAVRLPQLNWPFAEWVPNAALGAFDRTPGKTIGEVLGLPPGWPDSR